jgi:hypothetical protein
MALVDNAWYISSVAYAAVTAWTTGASFVAGNLIRQTTVSPALTERVFVCYNSTGGAGTTGASEPTWGTPTRGEQYTDNTIKWEECTGIAALNGDLTNTPTWATVKNTAITLGQVIQNVAGTLILICTVAGTAGSGAEPSWAAYTTAGATTTDNTVTWVTLGASFSVLAAPHARCANAFAANWGQAGNIFFVANNHAETQSSALSATVPSSVAVKSYVYSFDHTIGSAPPTSANLSAGASITTTGTSNLLFPGSNFYAYGLTFVCGTSGGPSLTFSNTAQSVAQGDTCAFQLGSGTTGGVITWGSASSTIELSNCTVQFGNAVQEIGGQGYVLWKNTPSAITGSTIPTGGLFESFANNAQYILDGVDLSALGSNPIVSGAASENRITLIRCKLGSGWGFLAGAITAPNERYDLIQCDSGATTYVQARYWYQGTLTQNTAIYRSGGASDGTTPISWQVATGATNWWTDPFKAFPIVTWNTLTGATRTVTVYGMVNAVAVPNNDQIWLEVEYMGSSGSPLASFVNNTKANNLATGTALTADSTSDWNNGVTARQNSTAYTTASPPIMVADNPGRVFFCISNGTTAGSEPAGYASAVDGGSVTDGTATFRAGCRFSMSVTLTAQLIGYLYGTVKTAQANQTFWIDPVLYLS